MAAIHGCETVAKYLMQVGNMTFEQINCPCRCYDYKQTAFIYACENGHLGVVRCIVEYVSSKYSNDVQKIIDIIRQKRNNGKEGFRLVVRENRLIREKRTRCDDGFKVAVRKNYVQIVKYLLQLDVFKDCNNIKWKMIQESLTIAAANQHNDIVKLLIQHGALENNVR